VVRDPHGHERTVELTPLAANERLTSVVIDEFKLPLARRRNAHRNWFERIPESKAVYFRYNTCADEPDQTVSALADRILAALDDGAERLIIDLRGNGGGDSGLLESFTWRLALRKRMQRPGAIMVLIGRATFSSAHMHANTLKKMGATLIGEPTGQKPNAYGEVRWFTLPHSQIIVHYSTKYWHTEPGDRPSLDPDVLIEPTSAEYLAGKDPVLDAALSYKPR
jgi:C-terminal processing protease CtpA/Prc